MRSLRLSQQQVRFIVEHCIRELPNEACGMIVGIGSHAEQVFSVKNIADHPERHYRLNPSEQVNVLMKTESQGLDWIGIFHSHPKSDPMPSLEDIGDAELNTPNLVHVIVSLKNNKSRLQAWHIHDGQVDKVELLIGQQRSQAIAPMSRLQIWAILFAILVGIVLLLGISFSLLPPAPALPTPQ